MRYQKRRVSDLESRDISLVPTSSTGDHPSLYDEDYSHTTDTVQVLVGEGNGASTFHVNKAELCRHSEYFRRNLHTQTVNNHIELDAEDPLTFQLFHTWLETQDPPPKYEPNEYSDEPWRSLAAQAHVLGQNLQARHFMHYALAQFIVNCALAEPDTWHFIEANTTSEQPLRRFSDHWIAWNTSLNQIEYLSFKAASLARQITKTTRDPRTYLIGHWDHHCAALLGKACVHNVKAQVIASQSIKPVYEETGRDWELNQRGRSRSASSHMPTYPPPSYPPQYRPRSVPSRATATSSAASVYSSENERFNIIPVFLMPYITKITKAFWIFFCLCTIICLGCSAGLLTSNYPSLAQFQLILAIAMLIHLLIAWTGWSIWDEDYEKSKRHERIKLAVRMVYLVVLLSTASADTAYARHCDMNESCSTLGALTFFTWVTLFLYLARVLRGFLGSRSDSDSSTSR